MTINVTEGPEGQNYMAQIKAVFDMPGIGELIEYCFRDANSPQELVTALQGLATEINNAFKSQNSAAISDLGMSGEMTQIAPIAALVNGASKYPDAYLDAYKSSSGDQVSNSGVPPVTEDCGLEPVLKDKQAQAAHAQGEEKDELDAEILDIIANIKRLDR